MIPFFRRSKSTLGVDIGSGYVKAAVVDHSGSEPVLTHAGYIPLVADAIVEGEIMDPAVVSDTVRTLVTGLGADAKRVVTAVGGRDVIVKKIRMDRMPAEDAREVIRWEAEQYVPFDMANVQLDFEILDPEGDGLQMDVLLVAAKSELVEQRIALLRDAGLTATAVDVDAFALHRALAYNYPGVASGVTGLVNVGHEVSSVVVIQGGVPVVTRDIPVGSRHAREDLRRLHALSSEEAEAALHGTSPRADEFVGVFANRGQELAMGIERAAAFLAVDSGGGSGLGGVHISGGGAKMPRLAETLSERLRVRAAVANPIQRLETRPDAMAHFPADELAPMLMLAIGLALRPTA
jgi:type IV pilus assembly protein PilM